MPCVAINEGICGYNLCGYSFCQQRETYLSTSTTTDALRLSSSHKYLCSTCKNVHFNLNTSVQVNSGAALIK